MRRAALAALKRALRGVKVARILDAGCGTGGMLIEVVHHVKEAGGKPQLLYGKLFGQEKNLTTAAIARA